VRTECVVYKCRTLLLFATALFTVLPILAAQANVAKRLAGSQAENPDGKAPAYDVISIKPHKAYSAVAWWKMLPNGLSLTNIPLKSLIGGAYGVMDDRISGEPGWTESDRFDVEAKMDDEAAAAFQKLPKQQQITQRDLMLQSLLADRCKIKVHHETKEVQTYMLVIAKGGFKLKEADPNNTYANGIEAPEGGPRAGMMLVQYGKLIGQALLISQLATQLAGQVGHLVEDKTGLKGKYDITLQWAPDEGGGVTPSVDSGPSVFTAIQEQLGLKLESKKSPVDTIVIDHIERPSEN